MRAGGGDEIGNLSAARARILMEEIAEAEHSQTKLSSNQNSSLPLAAADGNIDQFIHLTASRKSLFTRSPTHRTLLHIAASYNHPELVSYIIVQAEKSGGNLVEVKDRYGSTPLDDAVREGSEECVRVLEEVG